MRIVVEHNVRSLDGTTFPPTIIDAAEFGGDFDRFVGETHVHDDGMHNGIPVRYHQTFVDTSRGPWHTDWSKIVDADGKMVAKTTPRTNGAGNKHLLAAAPTLREALENLLPFAAGNPDAREALDLARAALRKARGE